MNKSIFTAGEIRVITTNLSNIEKSLGYSIPGGLVDVSELRYRLLSPGEIIVYCNNLRKISQGKEYRSRYNISYSIGHMNHPTVIIAISSLCILSVIFKIIEWITGMSIL